MDRTGLWPEPGRLLSLGIKHLVPPVRHKPPLEEKHWCGPHSRWELRLSIHIALTFPNPTFFRFPPPPPPLSMPVTLQTAYQGAVRCEYAVRGRVVARAMELEQTGKKIVYCNIGNPQSFDQKPITFGRQVLAACSYPELLNTDILSPEAKARAELYLDGMAGRSTGSYSHSAGVPAIRKDVAQFITKRDGGKHECRPDDLFITDGAGPGVNMLLRLLIRGPGDGLMIPVPRYPLYSALTDLLNGERIDYFQDESNEWKFTKQELELRLSEAKKRGVHVKAIVVVNPGNPTGNVLDKQGQRQVVEFCLENDLVLIADEVYQENVYHEKRKFQSFRSVALEMNLEHKVEIASLHSVSKGFFGECGRRGGYIELSTAFHPDVKATLYKMASVNLCSNLDGQVMMGVMCNPPTGEAKSLFDQERHAILSSLARRAQLVGKMLNTNNMSCVVPEGALYAFPQVQLPKWFLEKHAENPDEAYCLALLEETGIVVVPGSGFGQKQGTFHFRTTLLPPEKDLPHVLQQLVEFHERVWAGKPAAPSNKPKV
ncbi:hypothetical protein BASA81_000079 [Batrachochytrium salamandrivorans]|nr:hypothetical protein BASA81_000079 [Batrachochytrium salamandrivorans]